MRRLTLLSLPPLLAAIAVPRADSAGLALRPAVPIVARLPLYLGVPEANFVARLGPDLRSRSAGWPFLPSEYMRCSAYRGPYNPTYLGSYTWIVDFDIDNGRAIDIESEPGCFPNLREDWQTMARTYMPPDARFVGMVHLYVGLQSERYTSAWLAARLGINGAFNVNGAFDVTGSNGAAAAPGPDFTMEAVR